MSVVVITGVDGFIGGHLRRRLLRAGHEVRGLDTGSTDADWEQAFRGAETVFHLAGVNRAPDEADFVAGNVGATERLVELLELAERPVRVVFSSSTHAGTPTAYGRTKLEAEKILRRAAAEGIADVSIYRLPGVFGPGARPRYNSVMATLCHAFATGAEYHIDDRGKSLPQVFVSDVLNRFLAGIGDAREGGRVATPEVSPVFTPTLGEIEDALAGFGAHRETLQVPDYSDPFLRRLYATYLSYLPEDAFDYGLTKRSDARGSLAELLKSAPFGQVFVSRTNPGVTRGGHYHDIKAEKFVIVEGEGEVTFRNQTDGRRVAVRVRGEDFRVVDIPPGWAHWLQNVGDGVLVTLFWANEVFDPDVPDTYPAQAEEA